ncbi:MAG: hypothetical protein EOO74_04145 [Myxococcales bacterium]|nr:MAG: hypothetical protein EOO74_04145 [Myxococcales bacterium]
MKAPHLTEDGEMLLSEFHYLPGIEAKKFGDEFAEIHRLVPTQVFRCFLTDNPDAFQNWETTDARRAANLFADAWLVEGEPPEVKITTRSPQGTEVQWVVRQVERPSARMVGVETKPDPWTSEEIWERLQQGKPLLKLLKPV